MTRAIALGTLMAVGALSLAVSGYQSPSPAGPKAVEVEKLKDNLFVLKQNSMLVPAGTAYMAVEMIGVRDDGDYCDAYFDNVSVVLRLV